MFDLADEREQRRATRGFASAAEARGFLETARRLRPDGGGRPPTGAHARPRPAVGVDVDVAVAVAAVAHAPSPAIEPSDAESAGVAEREAAATAVFELLRDAGVIAPPPRALLGAAAEGSPVLRFHALMQEALARDASAAMARQEEAAWLANVLMAGATIDARPFTAEEASDAVVATCNLGLEGWPASWSGGAPVPDTFFVDHDLVTVFQVGWTLLHDEVCVATAACLLDVLAALPAHDPDTQAGVADLRATLRRYLRAGTPWQSRDALDVLATLDLPAWSTLLALIAECPVLPATIDPASPKGRRTVDPSAFTVHRGAAAHRGRARVPGGAARSAPRLGRPRSVLRACSEQSRRNLRAISEDARSMLRAHSEQVAESSLPAEDAGRHGQAGDEHDRQDADVAGVGEPALAVPDAAQQRDRIGERQHARQAARRTAGSASTGTKRPDTPSMGYRISVPIGCAKRAVGTRLAMRKPSARTHSVQ